MSWTRFTPALLSLHVTEFGRPIASPALEQTASVDSGHEPPAALETPYRAHSYTC